MLISTILLLFAGVVLTKKTGFIQIRRFFFTLSYVAKNIFKKGDKNSSITPFQALCTALSGTIGTGNIAGVATALFLGGAGALFWMAVAAFLGMATKYCEIVLAVKYRKKLADGSYQGGAMYYIKAATNSKFLAAAFAVLSIIASLFIGNMTQSNTAAASILSIIKLDFSQLSLLFATLSIVVLFVLLGGIKSISKVTSLLTPFMAIFYIGCCLFSIFCNIERLPSALCEIFTSAFQGESVLGGAVGFSVLKTVKVGFSRGLFTNEAGLGSAPTAHAAADAKSPQEQGLWGIFEVFFDTIVMCSLTGLTLLTSGVRIENESESAEWVIRAFETAIGSHAAVLVALSTVMFAVSTIIAWSYYGEVALLYLTKKKWILTSYKILYSAFIYIGAFSSMSVIWGLSDLVNGLMIIPNLIAILILRDKL